MEWMVLQTICGAAMVLIGAVIARGWPQKETVRPHQNKQEMPGNDTFAEDLAAMLGYTAETKEDTDE